MTTQYQHRITVRCPEVLIADANQLALIVGESPADDQTYKTASYEDALGNRYAICSFVAVTGFLSIPSMGLPPNPSYAEDADRAAAHRALDALVIWQPPADPENPDPVPVEGLLMAVDVEPRAALDAWGLSPIVEEVA